MVFHDNAEASLTWMIPHDQGTKKSHCPSQSKVGRNSFRRKGRKTNPRPSRPKRRRRRWREGEWRKRRFWRRRRIRRRNRRS